MRRLCALALDFVGERLKLPSDVELYRMKLDAAEEPETGGDPADIVETDPRRPRRQQVTALQCTQAARYRLGLQSSGRGLDNLEGEVQRQWQRPQPGIAGLFDRDGRSPPRNDAARAQVRNEVGIAVVGGQDAPCGLASGLQLGTGMDFDRVALAVGVDRNRRRVDPLRHSDEAHHPKHGRVAGDRRFGHARHSGPRPPSGQRAGATLTQWQHGMKLSMVQDGTNCSKLSIRLRPGPVQCMSRQLRLGDH